jgi:hypothetical protein
MLFDSFVAQRRFILGRKGDFELAIYSDLATGKCREPAIRVDRERQFGMVVLPDALFLSLTGALVLERDGRRRDPKRSAPPPGGDVADVIRKIRKQCE